MEDVRAAARFVDGEKAAASPGVAVQKPQLVGLAVGEGREAFGTQDRRVILVQPGDFGDGTAARLHGMHGVAFSVAGDELRQDRILGGDLLCLRRKCAIVVGHVGGELRGLRIQLLLQGSLGSAQGAYLAYPVNVEQQQQCRGS